MEPLDLTKRAPRSPWAQAAGLYMLPRTIDKLRASLPGGNMGDYKIAGFSERMLKAIGIGEAELRDVVARADAEEDVAKWVAQRAPSEAIELFNARAAQRRIADLDDPQDFFKRYPVATNLPKETPLFDALEKDDAHAFAQT